MSDPSPVNDLLVSFDQPTSSSPVSTPTKSKAMDFIENRSSEGLDLMGHHNGNGTNDNSYNGTNGNHGDEYHNGTNGNGHHDFSAHDLNVYSTLDQSSGKENGKSLLRSK